jgi:cleavage and polyadenylation specificity factor subunit 1
MHCFEGPEWLHLKRGRESFARGPMVKVDPQGRCGVVLVYDLQMIILKAAQVSFASYTLQLKVLAVSSRSFMLKC